jgi:hypothetical protein
MTFHPIGALFMLPLMLMLVELGRRFRNRQKAECLRRVASLSAPFRQRLSALHPFHYRRMERQAYQENVIPSATSTSS